jgi:hypothetical protein
MTSRCSKISGSRHDECWRAGFESTNDRFTTVSDQGSVIESDRPFFTSTEPTANVAIYEPSKVLILLKLFNLLLLLCNGNRKRRKSISSRSVGNG